MKKLLTLSLLVAAATVLVGCTKTETTEDAVAPTTEEVVAPVVEEVAAPAVEETATPAVEATATPAAEVVPAAEVATGK